MRRLKLTRRRLRRKEARKMIEKHTIGCRKWTLSVMPPKVGSRAIQSAIYKRTTENDVFICNFEYKDEIVHKRRIPVEPNGIRWCYHSHDASIWTTTPFKVLLLIGANGVHALFLFPCTKRRTNSSLLSIALRAFTICTLYSFSYKTVHCQNNNKILEEYCTCSGRVWRNKSETNHF